MPSLASVQIATQVNDGQIGVLNTIVNKNIIVVQYVVPDNSENYSPGHEVINSHTRYSTDFGKTWKEIQLDCTDETFLKYGINTTDTAANQMFGMDGAMISFIVRHSTGGKFYMYTPIIRRFSLTDDEMFNTRALEIVGWLVHDQTGARVDGGAPFSVPEVNPATDTTYLGVQSAIGTHINLNTAAIADGAPPDLLKPFTTHHYEPIHGGMINETYTGLGLVNRTQTVDYTFEGKRYTIVQLYKNVVVRKGNLYSTLAAGSLTVPLVGFDFYIFTLPFIYVFDHENFKNPDKSLKWVDVLNLEGRLQSLVKRGRGNKRARRFVRSLISDDPDFIDYPSLDTHHFEAYDGVNPVDTGVTFTNTPRGELMKVHDAADKKDLLGFVYGDRRFVCTGDPTVAANWVAGEVTSSNKYPRENYGFAFDRIGTNGNIILTQFDANAKYSEAHDLWYREYKVAMTRSATLRLDVAADRVFAIPDLSRTTSNDLTYRFMVFAKDPASGRYTIDFLAGGLDTGVEALTNTQYQGNSHYPVEVNLAAGILYNTSDFITERVIGQYSDPTDTVPEAAVENSIYVAGTAFDANDYNVFGTYCYYLNEYTVYEHKVTGVRVERMTDENANVCGYDQGNTQEPKGATILVYPDLELQINGSVPAVRCVQIESVFSGAGRLILRPKAADFDNRFPGSSAGIVSIKCDQPQTYGLTEQTATIALNLNQETVLTVAEYSGNQYYASAIQITYTDLRITNPFGGPRTFRLEGVSENLTLTAEGSGSIGTKIIIHRQGGFPTVTVNVSGRSAPVTRAVMATATLLEYSN